MPGERRESSETASTIPAVSTKVSRTIKRVRPNFEPFDGHWSVDEAARFAEEDSDLREAVRFAQRVDDCTEVFSERTLAVLAANGEIERPSQLQEVLDEATRERQAGSVTVPDVGAKQAFGEREDRPMLARVRMEEELQKQRVEDTFDIANWIEASMEEAGENSNNGMPSYGFSLSPDQGGDAEEQRQSKIAALRQEDSKLPAWQKNIMYVEKYYGYVYPWWTSTSVVVRLWGQLSCDLVLVPDAVLLKDIVQILGKDVVKFDPEINRKGPYSFGKLVENVNEMKRMILEKYADNPVLLGVLAKAARRKGDSQAPANENER